MRGASRGTLLVLGLMLSIGLAGCVGGDDVTGASVEDEAIAPAGFTDDTGGIEGRVIDAEGLPIPQVVVGLGQTEETTVTGEGGKFTFSNLEPKTYQVFAQKLGYDSAGKQATVTAGQAVEVELMLEQIEVAEPFHRTLNMEGLFGCGTSWRPAVVYSGVAICGVVAGTQFDSFILVFNFEGPMEAVASGVFETQWESNQIAGKGLSINWEKNGCHNVGDSRFIRNVGPNPHNGVIDGEQFESVREHSCNSSECEEDKCNIQSRVFSYPDTLGESSPADVGITIQQRYSNFITLFYHDLAPEGFSAVGDV